MTHLLGDRISVSLNLVEFELARMPSFKAVLEVMFSHPTGTMTYSSNNLWFGIEDWEKLLTSLGSGSSDCQISDLSYGVRVRLRGDGSKTNVEMKLRRRIAGIGEGELNLDFDESSEFRERLLIFANSIKHQYESAQLTEHPVG